MKTLQSAIEEAKNQAQKLLMKHARRSGEAVDVESVAKSLDLKITYIELADSDVSGFLKMEKNQIPEIVVNKNHGELRQRFTIAHEIGHYLMHPFDTLHVDNISTSQFIHYRNLVSSQATKLIEIEANQFAAELLMPSREIESLIEAELDKNWLADPDDVIKKLADRYKVSVTAMAIKVGTATH